MQFLRHCSRISVLNIKSLMKHCSRTRLEYSMLMKLYTGTGIIIPTTKDKHLHVGRISEASPGSLSEMSLIISGIRILGPQLMTAVLEVYEVWPFWRVSSLGQRALRLKSLLPCPVRSLCLFVTPEVSSQLLLQPWLPAAAFPHPDKVISGTIAPWPNHSFFKLPWSGRFITVTEK